MELELNDIIINEVITGRDHGGIKTAIRVFHKPTNIMTQRGDLKSIWANRAAAIIDLKDKLSQIDLDEPKLACCPKCENESISWCGISVRPYCTSCGHWAPVNFGTEGDAIRDWNRASKKAWETIEDKKLENKWMTSIHALKKVVDEIRQRKPEEFLSEIRSREPGELASTLNELSTFYSTINGVKVDSMPPYGCHSMLCPQRFLDPIVKSLEFDKIEYPFRMSKECRYDKQDTDSRCEKCAHPKDKEYVDKIKESKTSKQG